MICGILIPEAKEIHLERRSVMKGYYNNSGYMGYVEGRWVLFACKQDYTEYMEE